MTVNRRALVSVTIGLGLALAGCSRSPNAPTELPSPQPSRSSKVAVIGPSVASLAPDRLGYTFKFQLLESGGIPATISEVACEFDVTLGTSVVRGDKLGQNRRLPANGTLDVELTCPSPWGNFDETALMLVVSLTDDNGNRVWIESAVIKL